MNSARNNVESWVRGWSLNVGGGGEGGGRGSLKKTEGGGICCTGHWSCTSSRSVRPEQNKIENIFFFLLNSNNNFSELWTSLLSLRFNQT